MRQLQIYLTDACNLQCMHCLSDLKQNRNHISREYFDQLTDEALELNIRVICLSGGGEPTLHPQFGELIAMLARKGMQFSIATNGSLFRRKLQPVLEAHPGICTGVSFSLDGLEAVHDRFRRSPGNFQEVIHGLLTCKAMGVATAVKTCAHRLNHREFPELLAHLVSLEAARYMTVAMLVPVPSLEGMSELVLTGAEYDDLWCEIDRLNRKYQGKFEVTKSDHRRRRGLLDWCSGVDLLFGLYITPTGDYGYCCNAQSKGLSSVFVRRGEKRLAEAIKMAFRWGAKLKAAHLRYEATHDQAEEPYNICETCFQHMEEVGLITPDEESEPAVGNVRETSVVSTFAQEKQ